MGLDVKHMCTSPLQVFIELPYLLVQSTFFTLLVYAMIKVGLSASRWQRVCMLSCVMLAMF